MGRQRRLRLPQASRNGRGNGRIVLDVKVAERDEATGKIAVQLPGGQVFFVEAKHLTMIGD